MKMKNKQQTEYTFEMLDNAFAVAKDEMQWNKKSAKCIHWVKREQKKNKKKMSAHVNFFSLCQFCTSYFVRHRTVLGFAGSDSLQQKKKKDAEKNTIDTERCVNDSHIWNWKHNENAKYTHLK